MSREVSDVGWEPDGTVLVTFMDAEDVRCEGTVAVRQTIRIVRSNQYAEAIDALREAALNLVADALGDWQHSEPFELEDVDSSRSERPSGEAGRRAELGRRDIDERRSATPVEDRNWAAIVESQREQAPDTSWVNTVEIKDADQR